MKQANLRLFKLPEWFDKINSSDSILPLGSWDGVVRHYLEPLEEGAILCWTFTNPANPLVAQLFVRLTEHEAQMVASTSLRTTGMLELIRSTLSDPDAMIFAMDEGDVETYGVMPFLIKRHTSEESFAQTLDRAATFAIGWWDLMKSETEEYIAGHSLSETSQEEASHDSGLCAYHMAEARLRAVSDASRRMQITA